MRGLRRRVHHELRAFRLEELEDGVNGYRVPVEDVGALHDALVNAATDPAWRDRARARTLELARGYTPEAWAQAVANLAVKILP